MSAPDPALHVLLRLALALLFASACLHKLRDPDRFASSLRAYRLLPSRWSAPVAHALGVAEGVVAAALLLPALDPMGALGAACLLLLYTGAIGWNLARGRRHIDCGCMGAGREQPLSGWLVARNLALLAAPSTLLLAPAPRALSWIDAVSLAGGVTLLALLWHAAHQLLAVRELTGRSARWRP